MSVELDRVGWKDGTLVTPARVNVGGVTYDVTDAEYSGSTPLSAQNLKKMENNTERAINEGMEESTYASNAYTSAEERIGTWIDGKPIYRKVIYIASLPNHSAVAYPAGINNVNIVIDLYGIAHAQSGHNFPLPYVSMFSNNAENIEITYLSGTEVRVVTGSDRSSLSAHIVIEYTKTTD